MSMVHPLAGKPAPRSLLVNVPRLMASYYSTEPDPSQAAQRVAFGTAGHRGSSLSGSFNEKHILAISQAICDYRKGAGVDGPLYLGMDTHALSEAAQVTALEVLAANGVEVFLDLKGGYTPTPAVSFAILQHNAGRTSGLADGIVITPSHNPPADGGFKYNPPSGGPADTSATKTIEQIANRYLEEGCNGVRRLSYAAALTASNTHHHDFAAAYVSALETAIDFSVIRDSGITMGVDPLGGSGVAFWHRIAEHYRIPLTVINDAVDPTFSFMTVDRDGVIRMDCSSPWAMKSLIGYKDQFAVAMASDPDHDRHGIVTRSSGLLNPNHYLAVAIRYLFGHRPGWPQGAAVGKTLVSSAMIDRVAAKLGCKVVETPVGFKWFVEGLLSGGFGFAGEESAGASFLRQDGKVWTTDKDGILLGLLSAEITARTGRDPGEHYKELEAEHGAPIYERLDARATPAQKSLLLKLQPEDVKASSLGGDPIQQKLTRAPGNGAPIGGLKITTEQGWVAIRPSGTEDVYKVYSESFRGAEHIKEIQSEALSIVQQVFRDAGIAG